jgi:GT2 family glycosyltransferase
MTLGSPTSGAAAPDVSVIVVNYNTDQLLVPMRVALMQGRGSLSLQLIVVDNASRDGSVAVLKRDFHDAEVVLNEVNVGFGRANNQALPLARGRYVLLLNTDAFVEGDALTKTVAFMDANPDCGVLGVRLIGRDGTPQPACRAFPTPWKFFATRLGLTRFMPGAATDYPSDVDRSPRECDWVVGCFMLLRRQTLADCGFFDPRYFLYMEEVDLCRRAKLAGWKVMYFGEATVVHWGGESAKLENASLSLGSQISEFQMESELLYYRKHYGLPGLLSFVILAWLIDSIQALKWMLRGRSSQLVIKRAAKLWALLHQTHYGLTPTR